MSRRQITEFLRLALSGSSQVASPRHLRAAAVLIPLVWHKSAWHLILTKRAPTLRTQPGDISFPGGRVEPNDRDPLEAALRESHEEVGLSSHQVRTLGQLPQRETITGYWLTPFVGEVAASHRFVPNEEVAEILRVPIDSLSSNALRIEKRLVSDGTQRSIYHYQFREHDIWGITGKLVNELLQLIRDATGNP